jgi:hypothetical protein
VAIGSGVVSFALVSVGGTRAATHQRRDFR